MLFNHTQPLGYSARENLYSRIYIPIHNSVSRPSDVLIPRPFSSCGPQVHNREASVVQWFGCTHTYITANVVSMKTHQLLYTGNIPRLGEPDQPVANPLTARTSYVFKR